MSFEKKLKKIKGRRKKRVRSRIAGTEQRPRLSVFRSTRYIYVQAIDDNSGKTLAAASSFGADMKDTVQGKNKVDVAFEVGRQIARHLMNNNITEAVYDRGSYLYHGRVRALADGARQEGLKI